MNPPPPATGPALRRLPLLALGFVALIVGTAAGLARLGWSMPDLAAGLHGPLMIAGFFGVVIALERAVAIGRGWAFSAPLAAGLGTLALLTGAPWAPWLHAAGAIVLTAATLDVFRRQRALFTFTLLVAAVAYVAGCLLWAGGRPLYEVVPWWLAFLVLTIAGERLELSRLRPPSARAARLFAAIVAAVVLALLAGHSDEAGAASVRLLGAALVALAAWLLRNDIAQRTVRQRGLTRFIAVCLLSGYLWLAAGGAVMLGVGALQPGTAGYDAALHALLLGFVFSMVFGHAPIIFPAVLRVAVPYHPVFYAPLVLLHASLLVRLGGDATGALAWTRAGGLLGAIAVLAFVASTAGAVLRGRASGVRPAQ